MKWWENGGLELNSLLHRVDPQVWLIEKAQTVLPQFISGYVAFVKQMRAGDELWQYSNMRDLAGSSGKAILRKGRIVDVFTEAIS